MRRERDEGDAIPQIPQIPSRRERERERERERPEPKVRLGKRSSSSPKLSEPMVPADWSASLRRKPKPKVQRPEISQRSLSDLVEHLGLDMPEIPTMPTRRVPVQRTPLRPQPKPKASPSPFAREWGVEALYPSEPSAMPFETWRERPWETGPAISSCFVDVVWVLILSFKTIGMAVLLASVPLAGNAKRKATNCW